MAVDKDLLLVVKSSRLGEGEPEIGARLLKTFFSVLLESGQLPAKIIFMNSGVFLTTEENPALELLQQCAAQGSELFSCGTCLEYYQRKDKLLAGKTGNMRDTVAAMLEFKKAIQI
jgi:selenium metabolism protein YedF